MDEKQICTVCGNSSFGYGSNKNICKCCGFEAGVENELSLEDFKKRYQNYLALNPDYVWIIHGFPEITEKKLFLLAHSYSLSNEESIKESRECGCFYCLSIFSPDQITDWVPDRQGRTARCPFCGIDAVLPDRSIHFDRAFLQGMHDTWF